MPKNPKNILIKLLLLFMITLPMIGQSQEKGEILFSHTRGFYNTGFSITITTDIPNANIHYTLDGTEPGGTVGQSTNLYNQSIAINKTSCLRANKIIKRQ